MAVGGCTVEGEDDAPVGIVLREDAGVVAFRGAPAPAYDKAVAGEELHIATRLGEVVAARVEHITAAKHFACVGVDLKADHAGNLGGMDVAVVEERQRVVIVEHGIVLA